MKSSFLISCYLIIYLIFSGCTPKVSTLGEYTQWLQDSENGCITARKINGLTVSLCYLPYPYLALRDMRKYSLTTQANYDSLINRYKYNLEFLMTIKTNDGTDVMYKGVSDLAGYSDRQAALNFNIENKLLLHSKTKSYRPVLASLENTYGLSKDIKVNIVFSPSASKEELFTASTFDVEYTDETFDLGTMHSFFEKENIHKKLPVFEEIKN